MGRRKEWAGRDKDREGAGRRERVEENSRLRQRKAELKEGRCLKQSDKPPQVDSYWVSPSPLAQITSRCVCGYGGFIHWGVNDLLLFLLQHRRPGNRPDELRISLGYSAALVLPCITRVPPGAQFRSSAAFDIALKDAPICTCVCLCWTWVSSLRGWDLPPLNAPFPQLRGPWAHTKHAEFNEEWEKEKEKECLAEIKVEGFFKTATVDLFDREREEGERGGVKRHSGCGDKYVHMEPHYTHVTSHYLQISSTTPQLAAVSQ